MNEPMLVSGFIGLGIALLFIRLAALERRIDRLSRLDAKVDALLRHSGIAFDPYQGVPSDVREALERGKTILAIKRLRQATGIGLKEAKDARRLPDLVLSGETFSRGEVRQRVQ